MQFFETARDVIDAADLYFPRLLELFGGGMSADFHILHGLDDPSPLDDHLIADVFGRYSRETPPLVSVFHNRIASFARTHQTISAKTLAAVVTVHELAHHCHAECHDPTFAIWDKRPWREFVAQLSTWLLIRDDPLLRMAFEVASNHSADEYRSYVIAKECESEEFTTMITAIRKSPCDQSVLTRLGARGWPIPELLGEARNGELHLPQDPEIR